MAGTMILIAGCAKQSPRLQLLKAKRFTHFSSASAIEYAGEKLFGVGDDATYLLVLDTGLHVLDRVAYWQGAETRIPKESKPDLEAATILAHGDQAFLYAFGSLSTPLRYTLYQFPLDSLKAFTQSPFRPRPSARISEWNIEGATMVDDQLILANRANNTNRDNFLVLHTFAPAGDTTGGEAKVLQLSLPEEGLVKGVSGLFYEPQSDRLFFTASEEDTENAVADGAIGESYLGWIEDFSRKMFRNSVVPDALIKLSNIDRAFLGQKIESVCALPPTGKGLVLFLAADNDNGQSQLFKVALAL